MNDLFSFLFLGICVGGFGWYVYRDRTFRSSIIEAAEALGLVAECGGRRANWRIRGEYDGIEIKIRHEKYDYDDTTYTLFIATARLPRVPEDFGDAALEHPVMKPLRDLGKVARLGPRIELRGQGPIPGWKLPTVVQDLSHAAKTLAEAE